MVQHVQQWLAAWANFEVAHFVEFVLHVDGPVTAALNDFMDALVQFELRGHGLMHFVVAP